MAKKTEVALLQAGNETVKLLKADRLTRDTKPYGSWEVSFTVDRSTLLFSVFLDYEVFERAFKSSIADPVLWITVVALFATTALNGHLSELPRTARVGFVVNGDEHKDWKASCTVARLVKAGKDAEGKTLDGASTVMMMAMELE